MIRHNTMAACVTVFLASALFLAPVTVLAQAPERLSDKDVKALIDPVDEGRDKFEGNLDGAFKGRRSGTPPADQGVWRAPGLSGQHAEAQEPVYVRLQRQR